MLCIIICIGLIVKPRKASTVSVSDTFACISSVIDHRLASFDFVLFLLFFFFICLVMFVKGLVLYDDPDVFSMKFEVFYPVFTFSAEAVDV